MTAWLAVGLGGFAGALARYAVSGWMHRWYGGFFPLGTLTVNVAGCLIMGFVMTLVELSEWGTPQLRLLVVTGFLGSLTTFSTFGYEMFELVRQGKSTLALVSLATNVLLGVGGVLAGRMLAMEVV